MSLTRQLAESKRALRSKQRLLAATGIITLNLALAGAALGQTVWTAGNNNNDWFQGGNWTLGIPTAGQNVVIDTVSPFPTVVGLVPFNAVANNLTIGNTPGGIGQLTVENGHSLTLSGNAAIGVNGSMGTLNIGSPGSSVPGGSVIVNGGMFIGDSNSQSSLESGVGIVNVTGPSASLILNGTLGTGFLVVGAGNGTGTLNIVNGGTVSSAGNIIIGNALPGIAVPAGQPLQGNGTVLVSGAGSTLSATTTLTVGQYGIGTLTIQNGGVVNAPGGTFVSTIGLAGLSPPLSAVGTINIGAPPGQAAAAPGTLNTPVVHLQNGFGANLVGTPGTLNFNHTSTDYVFTPMITGTGPGFPNIGVVNVIAGTTIFTAGGTPGGNDYGGPTTIFGGATLAAGGVDVFSANSNTIVNSGGALNLESFNQTLNNGLTNAGTVQLPASPGVSAPGTVLIVNNYVGNNGVLVLNTFLGADNSASDQLVINHGTAMGTTSLNINNVGGPGLQTTSNGILVVNAINGATTALGSFTLDNPELRAGAFDYRLFQGSPNGSDPAVANDWFLRSTFIEEPGPGPGPGPGPEPIIGPELATYGVVQPIARQMGLTTLGTLHERIGDTLADPCQVGTALPDTSSPMYRKAPVAPGCCPGATPSPDTSTPMFRKAPVAPTGCAPYWGGPSIWARVFGQQVNNHYEAFADPRADGHVVGFQSGVDLWRGSLLPSHRDAAGFYGAYANGNVNVTGLVTNPAATAFVLTHTGSLNLDAWSGGAYWTHYGPTGWYLDAVLQGTAYQGRASTAFASLSTNGWGFITSLESGYPIPVRWLGPSFVLEPQAQILWQQVSFNDDNDGLGNVALGTTSGATGRIGLRGQWTVLGAAGQVWQPYVSVNLWRDWGAQANTTFDTDVVPLQEQATRLDVGTGVTARITRNLSLFAQGGYQFAVGSTDGGKRDGVKGDGGIRYTW